MKKLKPPRYKDGIKCMQCGELLFSLHRHDFNKCDCSNETFIDGGNDYLRCGGIDLAKVQIITFDTITRKYKTLEEDIKKKAEKKGKKK